MLDFQQLTISFLIPGLLIWGSTFCARRWGFSCRIEIAAAIGIAVALFVLRWLDEWNSLSGEAKTLGDSLTLAVRRFWFPKEARDWLAVGLLVAVPMVALDHLLGRARWFVLVWGTLLALTLWRFLLGSVYLEQWTTALLGGRLLGFGVLVAICSGLLGIGDRDSQPLGFLKRILVAFVFVMAAMVSMTSGSISGGVIGLLAAAAFGHAAIAGTVFEDGRRSPISAGFWIFVLTAVLAVGFYFSEITTTNFLALVIAASVAGLVEFRSLSRKLTRLVVVLALIASLGMAMTAAGLSVKKAMDEMQKKSENPYSKMY